MDASTLQAVAALSAVLVAAAGLLVGAFFWLLRDLKQDFTTEAHRLDDKIDRLDEKADRNKEELREEMRQMEERILRGQAELREELRLTREELREELRLTREELREELRLTREELREELRRGNAQLLAALSGHTHDADTGAAVFRELPAADDD